MTEIKRLIILLSLLFPAVLLFSAIDCNCKLNCEDTHIGLAELHFIDSSFFPLQPNEEIEFANNKGFKGKFVALNIQDTIKQWSNDVIASRCHFACFEYYSYHERTLSVALQQNDLDITYTHGKMVEYQERVENIDTLPDKFQVQIGDLFCAFLIEPFPEEFIMTANRENLNTKAEMIDSLEWHGKSYRQVVHFFRLSPDPGIVKISGAYYALSKGIIGFYLSNGEEWYIN